ncbi:MAG: hypothetical protein ACREUF_08470 [Solimonas sp.]
MSSDDIEEAGPALLLSHNDRNSPAWVKLRKHMEARLQSLRARNDNDLDPIATAKLRGECRVLKNLLALGKPDPAMGADDELGE